MPVQSWKYFSYEQSKMETIWKMNTTLTKWEQRCWYPVKVFDLRETIKLESYGLNVEALSLRRKQS